MPQIRDILDHKGQHLHTISPGASVFDAAVVMNEHKIGCLVVVEDGRMVGIFTERDILQRIVAEGRDARRTLVAGAMTIEVAYGQLHTSVEEARTVMKERRIRHLPVLNDHGEILGLISMGDLNAFELDGQESTIHLLHQYITTGGA